MLFMSLPPSELRPSFSLLWNMVMVLFLLLLPSTQILNYLAKVHVTHPIMFCPPPKLFMAPSCFFVFFYTIFSYSSLISQQPTFSPNWNTCSFSESGMSYSPLQIKNLYSSFKTHFIFCLFLSLTDSRAQPIILLHL